jgi:hypothetical protein
MTGPFPNRFVYIVRHLPDPVAANWPDMTDLNH